MKFTIKFFISLTLCWVTTYAAAFTDADISNRVKALDTNNDGGVSKTEADAGHATRIKQNFEKLDANKDGIVTAEEIVALNK